MYTIADLLDMSHTLAAPLFAGKTYPYEVLDGIKSFILELGATLSPEEYDHPKEDVWIAKDATIKRLASQRTTKFAVLNAYVNAKLMGLDYDINKKIYEIMPSLQLKDIVNFEKNLMANKQYRYLILGDEKNLDMKALEKIGPIKRVSTEEIFGY